MITCKACGFTSDRLQWTHFKFKCIGKYKNGKEYQKDFPGAPLVSDQLRLKTAVTKNNLIKKYGEADGLARWNTYTDKQRHSNSFEYKSATKGWTRDEFEKYNKSRAVTLEAMIIKYGESEGLKRFDEYCQKQKITKTKEYFISKHGIERWDEVCKQKAKSSDPHHQAQKLGISVEDAMYVIHNRGLKYTSSAEIQFISMLETSLGEPLEFSGLTKQFGKMHSSGYMFFDVKHNDVIIEFNGDYWHANPKKYTENEFIRGVPVIEIWERDRIKREVAESSGYRFITVWESEFTQDKLGTIERIKQWMLNGREFQR